MGCLEQRNPLTSRLGGEGVLCVIGGRVSRGWGTLGAVGSRGTCPVLLCSVLLRPVLLGRILGGGHLLPDGAHLLGGFLQRAAIIDNPGCDRLTLLVGCLRGDAGARILLTHAA